MDSDGGLERFVNVRKLPVLPLAPCSGAEKVAGRLNINSQMV